jgi:hypothetical protein
VLVTNPPYSDDHKARIFDFGMARLADAATRTPFFVLVPAYVASRAYFRSCLDRHGLQDGVVYLVPGTRDHGEDDYRYEHPDATGKKASPFRSLWVCGIGRDETQRARDWWIQEQQKSCGYKQRSLFLYCSLGELERAGVVSALNRPNPRQRKKRKNTAAYIEGGVSSLSPAPSSTVSTLPPTKHSPEKALPAKKSKYRDESGKRSRRRF